MIALARFYKLEIKHAHTNSAPTIEDHEWYSENCGDTMIIARKPYSGEPKVIDLENYKCIPENHQKINNGMKNYQTYKEYTLTKTQEARGNLKPEIRLIKKVKDMIDDESSK